MAKLSLPSRKLFANDLKEAIHPGVKSSLTLPSTVWTLPGEANDSDFTLVWIQGKIVEENRSEKSFILDDESAVVRVCKSSQLVQACSDLSVGKYLMVIGELLQAGNLPLVKAIKIQDLSEDPVLRDMWKYEVLDFKKYLSAQLSS